MKKLLVSFATAALLLIMIPSHAEDATVSTTVKGNESVEVNILVNRVNEIKEMDKSTLSLTERKELRKELREIKREVNRRSGNVVYVSGGLILLIVLLIILL